MTHYKLLVLDIDNTVFDWVTYYVHAIEALLSSVETSVGVPYQTLVEEAREVFTAQSCIEYPFLVQSLPSVQQHFDKDLPALFQKAVEPGRQAFNEMAKKYLKPYAGVEATLQEIKKVDPKLLLIALTDSPRYVAMWKLNKLGLLSFFDAIYGLPDPVLPTHEEMGAVLVDDEILIKHVRKSSFNFKGRIRVLPEDYEKPGTKGLKTVLMDFDMDEDPAHRQQVLWVGDNLRKDVGLGKRLGVVTGWAKYGTTGFSEYVKKLTAISPLENLRKHTSVFGAGEEMPQPDFVFEKFADLLLRFK